MIFDASIWIEFLNGKQGRLVDQLQDNIENGIVYICPPIFQEILQGIKSDRQYDYIKERLIELNFLDLDPYFISEQAAQLYRLLRKRGLTIDKPNDCLIAAYAIHFNLILAHKNRDFDKIAKHTSLRVYST